MSIFFGGGGLTPDEFRLQRARAAQANQYRSFREHHTPPSIPTPPPAEMKTLRDTAEAARGLVAMQSPADSQQQSPADSSQGASGGLPSGYNGAPRHLHAAQSHHYPENVNLAGHDVTFTHA